MSCAAHGFDLPCRLQDLKCRASNGKLQMVKDLPQESNVPFRTDMLLLELCDTKLKPLWLQAFCFAIKNTN